MCAKTFINMTSFNPVTILRGLLAPLYSRGEWGSEQVTWPARKTWYSGPSDPKVYHFEYRWYSPLPPAFSATSSVLFSEVSFTPHSLWVHPIPCPHFSSPSLCFSCCQKSQASRLHDKILSYIGLPFNVLSLSLVVSDILLTIPLRVDIIFYILQIGKLKLREIKWLPLVVWPSFYVVEQRTQSSARDSNPAFFVPVTSLRSHLFYSRHSVWSQGNGQEAVCIETWDDTGGEAAKGRVGLWKLPSGSRSLFPRLSIRAVAQFVHSMCS